MGGRVTVAFLAEQLTDALARIAKLEAAAPPTRIGFKPCLPDLGDLADARGGSLKSENTHEQDRDADEFGDDPETRRR